MNIYQQNILDHYKHPRNAGELLDAQVCERGENRSCGDKIVYYLQIDGEKIQDLRFSGSGCAISQATASLLGEKAKHESLETVLSWKKEDILTLLGVDLGPTRLKCALLSLEVLQNGVSQFTRHTRDLRKKI